jgi:mono/diheme cytochrome c family protein
VLGALAVCVGLGALACSKPAPERREWSLADHDNRGGVTTRKQQEASGHGRPTDDSALVEVTWERQCSSCHGERGRGDGPMSPMVQAKDLSDPAWQASVTDAAIAETVLKGKGRMPAVNLPEPMVQELVKMVRTFARRAGTTAPTAQVQAPPSGAPLPPSPPARAPAH